MRKLEIFSKYAVTQPCMDVKFQANHFENSKSSKEQVVIAVSCWNGIIKILNTNEI